MAAEPGTWVVDASVAFGWFAAVPGSEQAALLLDAEHAMQLLAPDLVLVELLNTGWKSLRMGAITSEQFQVLSHRAAEPFHRLVPATALLARAGHWCRELDHPAYNCLYVAPAGPACCRRSGRSDGLTPRGITRAGRTGAAPAEGRGGCPRRHGRELACSTDSASAPP